ncbi:hypothetical protein [Rhizobium sp. BK251]|uniref:DUF6894 family protein n=1 Tax=Rhizobium sp. BK251 TaxID=2512125 RepID=UPI00104578BA|nr:hypothetical protein [Rhizobium sp. BK251]TCL63281.1 hypothetical protein EV286_11795 [Rhizobium sp. BK251]
MSIFYFKTEDLDTVSLGDNGYDFPDLMSAIHEAKRLLAEMALDGIPEQSGKRLSVEVSNAQRIPIAKLSLELTISYAQT